MLYLNNNSSLISEEKFTELIGSINLTYPNATLEKSKFILTKQDLSAGNLRKKDIDTKLY